MSRSARMVGAVLIPAFTFPLATANVARAAVPDPPTNNRLPSGLDIASPYVPQSVCDPAAKPGVTAFARLMANHYSEFSYGISRECNNGLTEHSEGRALDWMLDANDEQERATADAVISWLLAPDSQGRPAAMARRFGIMYIIWNEQIWGTYQMSDGWRPYHGVSPHTDHIHFSFSWDGAMQRTSWWTGKPWTDVTRGPGGPSVPINPPSSYPTLREGGSGPDVVLAQKVLGVTADGAFGPATKKALLSWQRSNGVRATGVMDKATWDKMVRLGKIPARGDSSGSTSHDSVRRGATGESVKELQRILKVQVDGVFGSGTDKAVREFQKKKSLRVDGYVTANVWKALKGQKYVKNGTASKPESEIPDSVRKGARGAAVKELQKELGISADGVFGSGTDTAVREFQKKKSLRVDGFVTANVWKALKGQKYVKNGAAPEQKPKPKPESEIPDSVRKGARGAAVKELQKALGLSADGVFGSGTDTAVREFQKKKSLRVDGFVTANVWKALKGQPYTQNASSSASTPEPKADPEPEQKEPKEKPKATQEPKEKPEPKESSSSSAATKVKTDTEFTHLKSSVLAEGSRSSGVKSVQRTVGGVAVDGSYGSGTTKAVRSFQRVTGLEPTGIVDEKTWDALEEKKYPFLKYRKTVLKPGSTGPAVEALQAYLGLPVDGTYGESMEQSIKTLQKQHGLTRTGYVGSVTWEALEREVTSRR